MHRLFLTLVATTLFAGDVPFTFSAGTPARADEVNANFGYLNGLAINATTTATSASDTATAAINATNTLSNRVTTLEAGTSPLAVFHGPLAMSLSYTSAGASVGTVVNPGYGSYRIVALPVADPAGGRYRIFCPARVYGSSSLQVGLSTWVGTRGTAPSKARIGAYDADYAVSRSSYVTISTTTSTLTGQASGSTSLTVTIALTNSLFTAITIPVIPTDPTISGSMVTSFPLAYDLSTDAAFTTVASWMPNVPTSVYDNLLDYIRVEVMP